MQVTSQAGYNIFFQMIILKVKLFGYHTVEKAFLHDPSQRYYEQIEQYSLAQPLQYNHIIMLLVHDGESNAMHMFGSRH